MALMLNFDSPIAFSTTVSVNEVKNYKPNAGELELDWSDQLSSDIQDDQSLLDLQYVNHFVAWVGNKAIYEMVRKCCPKIDVSKVLSKRFEHPGIIRPQPKPKIKVGDKIFVLYEVISDHSATVGRVKVDLTIKDSSGEVILKLIHNLQCSEWEN